jgi:hypothetical protein
MKHECPRFNHCNAPICPLDTKVQRRTHLDGEPVCFYMRELVKPGGFEHVETAMGPKLTQAVQKAVFGRTAPHIILHKRLKRASLAPARFSVRS